MRRQLVSVLRIAVLMFAWAGAQTQSVYGQSGNGLLKLTWVTPSKIAAGSHARMAASLVGRPGNHRP